MSEKPQHRIKRQRYLQNRAAKAAKNAEVSESKARTALVLGGGAPNSALMAGALAAFDKHGITFDVVSTSGAGGLIGLLWLAPKDATPQEALKNWVNAYVDDTIYNMFPVDYKVFFKPGFMADAYRQWLNMIPGYKNLVSQPGDNPMLRLWSDLVQLGTATLSPSSLSMDDPGLCARVPWASDMVDFDKVKNIKPYFYLNAYNITKQIMDDFSKDEITLDHFKAAFAFPFIYGPYTLNGEKYYEGATRDCLNFRDLMEKHTGLETIVVFDVLGAENLIRAPRDLYDSWVLSMIIPLVSVAEDDLELFVLKHNNGWRRKDGAKTDLLVVPFDIPEDKLETVLDWSYSNGRDLFDIGYKSAENFIEQHGKYF
jgi:NTE family protein